MLVEVIATNLEEALLAEKFGAHRVELIHAFTDGGLSPCLELSREVCEALTIPVNVMVRPHGENFIYDQNDMYKINSEIDYLASKTKASAIVFGALNLANSIDYRQLESVLGLLDSSHLGLTFHRAIDVANDVVGEFMELQNYAGTSLQRVLSSGGADTALNGISNLASMQRLIKPSGGGVKLLAGSGVKPINVIELLLKTQVEEIHLGTGLRVNNKLNDELFQQLFKNLETF
jgi:copper homeostasis protein